jgi:sialic acid synthase SpsE
MVDINLRAIDTMVQEFGLRIGYSDHSEGITIPIAAVARGAEVIEKHFTLDRNLPGPDHKASLEPNELIDMVRAIRDVEASLGDGNKIPRASELTNRDVARKSIVAKQPIKKNEPFTEQNIAIKRPGTGISPMEYWSILGVPSTRDYEVDEQVEMD